MKKNIRLWAQACDVYQHNKTHSCRGVKEETARIVHTGVPQGSKLSPSQLIFYLAADTPRPTYPVKRICYNISHKVNSYFLYPRYETSQVPPINQYSCLSTSTEPQPEDLRGPPGHIANFQRTLHTSGNKSQRQKQRLEGLCRHYLATTKCDDTDDLQGKKKVGRQLRCPSLEYQCKRHQHRKNSDCAEQSPVNSYRISKDVKHRSSPQ